MMKQAIAAVALAGLAGLAVGGRRGPSPPALALLEEAGKVLKAGAKAGSESKAAGRSVAAGRKVAESSEAHEAPVEGDVVLDRIPQQPFGASGHEIGSDADIENEVSKLMSDAQREQRLKEASRSTNGEHGKDGHVLSMATQMKNHARTQDADRAQIGSDADVRRQTAKLVNEAEADKHRVILHEKNEAWQGFGHAKQLGLQKQPGQKHRVHANRRQTIAERNAERRRSARRSREFASSRSRQERAERKELATVARDKHLLSELGAVRKDVVRALRDGNKEDERAAAMESKLFGEADRLLKETIRGHKYEHSTMLQQHGSRVSAEADSEQHVAADLKDREASFALRASARAGKEARMEAHLLHETTAAEEAVRDFVHGKDAEDVKKLVVQDLEKARLKEKQAIAVERRFAERARHDAAAA